VCTANGIRHLLTAPYSPTTTGKVERFRRTLRTEFFAPNDYRATVGASGRSSIKPRSKP
jgi:transposase InsO family protein